MSSATPIKGGSTAKPAATSLDDLGAEFENMRASAKLEFLRQKKEQDRQRAAEAKAKQDAADHRAALVAVFAGVKVINETIDKVYDESWSYRFCPRHRRPSPAADACPFPIQTGEKLHRPLLYPAQRC